MAGNSGIAVNCNDSSVNANANADGDVGAADMSTRFRCVVYGDGRAVCDVDQPWPRRFSSVYDLMTKVIK